MSTLYWFGFRTVGGGPDQENGSTPAAGNTEFYDRGFNQGGQAVIGIEPTSELGPSWDDIEGTDTTADECQMATGVEARCTASPTVTQHSYLIRKERGNGVNIDFTIGSVNAETGTFTPQSNSLLFLFLALRNEAEITSPSVTDSDAGTWTRIANDQQLRLGGTASRYLHQVWVREVATAAAMSITVDCSQNATTSAKINCSVISVSNPEASDNYGVVEITDYASTGAYTIDMSSLAVSALELLPVTNPVQNVAFAPPRTRSEKRLYCRV